MYLTLCEPTLETHCELSIDVCGCLLGTDCSTAISARRLNKILCVFLIISRSVYSERERDRGMPHLVDDVDISTER